MKINNDLHKAPNAGLGNVGIFQPHHGQHLIKEVGGLSNVVGSFLETIKEQFMGMEPVILGMK